MMYKSPPVRRCPKCGYFQADSVKDVMVMDLNGELVETGKMYRCKKCGRVFTV